MKRRFETIAKHLRAGENLLLMTVLHTEGSVPRQAGTQLLLFSDGRAEGTVGGGEMELLAVQRGRALLQSGTSAVERYALPHGEVLIAMQHLAGGDLRLSMLFEDAAVACEAEGSQWLLLRLEENGTQMEPALCNGTWIAYSPRISMEQARPLLWKKVVYVPGEPAWFCLPLARAARTFVFGAGHVAQKLVPLLKSLDTPVTVIDPRAELCRAELFPDAQRCIAATPEQALTRICLGERDEVVVMTSDPDTDFEVLVRALCTEAAYVGCIGSGKKIDLLRERLRAAGMPEERLDRLHAPIGLEIGAQTPAEIAVSIAAELIASRAAAKTKQA